MRRLLLFALVLAAPLPLAACHTRGGYFDSDPELALGPGVPDCPSRKRWPAYYGTETGVPERTATYGVVPQVPPPPSPRLVAATPLRQPPAKGTSRVPAPPPPPGWDAQAK